MKSKENIEKFVRDRKPDVTTGRQMDNRVLDDSFAAMDEMIRAKKPSAARIILRSRTTKLAAAAAVIIVVISLFIIYQSPNGQSRRGTSKVTKSPVEMLTVLSLNIAYRRGGIEAVDEQSNKAFEMLGSQRAIVSVKELLAESNGV